MAARREVGGEKGPGDGEKCGGKKGSNEKR